MIATMFFLSGITFISFLLAGMFFLKFWRASGDRFFKCLWLACWLIATERIIALVNYVIDPSDSFQSEIRPWLYLFRLGAFILIIIPVIKRNYSDAK